MQLRAKKDIAKHQLKLAPIGGVLIPHLADQKDRFTKEIKKNEALHECYIRAVTADVQAVSKYGKSEDHRPVVGFSIVSPLGMGVAEEEDGPEGQIHHKAKHLAPYWAVLLAARTSKSIVNMAAVTNTYKCGEPRIQNTDYELAGWAVNLEIQVPVLTNIINIKAGDLLVLPMNGMNTHLILKDDVGKHTDSWLPANPAR